jgi:DNA-directed RNA polymerase specialized sigma24 family protein
VSEKRGSWEPELQKQCDVLVETIVASPPGAAPRARAWRELLRLVSPSLERWSRFNSTLARAGLRSEDDWRAVLVRAVERLARRDYANLRSYVETRERRKADGTLGPTPFEAWLRQLVKFAAADELTRYLSVKRVQPSGGANTVEGLGAEPPQPKRSLLTDLDVRQRSAAIRDALAKLKEDQRCALAHRLEGASYEEIAAALSMTRDEALNLVRSAKACLRRGLRPHAPQEA